MRCSTALLRMAESRLAWIGSQCCFPGEESIREVIAFPKTSTAQCLMTDSPSEVSQKQLSELHIALKKDENKRQ